MDTLDQSEDTKIEDLTATKTQYLRSKAASLRRKKAASAYKQFHEEVGEAQ